MENSFQTSFIPKKPISTINTTVKTPKSIFTTLAIILLIIVSIASVGFFIYKSYLIKQKDSLSAILLKVRGTFDQGTINELELFDKRSSIAKNLLDNHTVFSPTFKLLGNLTIPTIQYTKFNLAVNKNKDYEVRLSGISKDYKSIALQSDVFNGNKNNYFKNVVFSNLTKNKKNYVTFNLEFTIDPVLLSYEKNILLEQAQSSSTNPSTNLPNNLNTN